MIYCTNEKCSNKMQAKGPRICPECGWIMEKRAEKPREPKESKE